jgi:preprotein translocase subunit SecE
MKTVVNFIKESIDEMRFKVSWPKYGELQNSAVLVIVSSLIFALLIWGMDYLFKNGISSIYKYF